MFTANSMNCLCEAIGMALPGSGTCLATSPARLPIYQAAAGRIVAMTKQWIRGGRWCGSLGKIGSNIES